MGKKRIYELAKELSLTSADLIEKIQEWKLLPGVKLVASSGIEDYLVEDISQRLNMPQGQAQQSPQVVRRRKKVSDQPEGDSIQDNDEPVADAPEDAAEKQPEPAAPDTVEKPKVVRPPKSEAATIIATIDPSRLKDPQAKVPAQDIVSPVPDFRKLAPAATSSSSADEFEQAAPVKAAEAAPTEAAAPPADDSNKAAEPKAEAPPEKLPSRKITRELSDPPARIVGSAPRSADAAKVVGVKTGWTSSRPDGHHAPRPAGGRPAQPGGSPDWSARRPAADSSAPPRGAAPGRSDFRRVEPEAVPLVDNEASRRRDKKKKGPGGARFDSDENFGKGSRRRDVVERTDLYSEGDWERVRRRGKNAKKLKMKAEASVPKAIKRRIKVDDVITVSELAHRLSIKAGDIIKKLMSMGVMAGLNQALDFDTATIVAGEFGYEVEKSAFDEDNILQLDVASTDAPLLPRPPVVTIMGHVDHGKTSLLDYIRKTNIQSGEAGGITQHIGAYHVKAGGRNITFLDTPGHEAFTSMRSRGAQVTDIVILIVAADDGLMPQTREAADHAKAAGVPIIVAINKVDKPAADPERVRREMMEIGLVAEAWGGDTVFVEISAKTGQGIDELLDMILLQADILDLTARAEGPARGRIIEARLDKGRGPVATVLVQEGLLKQGSTYVCGVFYGRIRAMLDDQGNRVAEAGPAIPVEVQGISGVPQAGDEFIALEDEKQARQVSQHRLLKQRESELIQTSKLTLENLFDNIKAGAVKGLNLIIKTDVQGSLEAIVDAVMKLSTPALKINIIHQSTGAVSETDILLASASNALVICFGVRPPTKVQELADSEHIQIRYYDVIYKLMDDIKEALAGLLDPVKSEKVLGRAEVRQTFSVTKVGTIAGCYVVDGKIVRGAKARLLRDSVVVHDGRIGSLKRMKDDAREVASGYECGIGFDNYNDVKIGDHIEAYQVEETAATVDLVDEAVAKAAKDKEDADRAAAAEAAAAEAAE
ncbi:translation initiation factor IF-2 [Deltaproteobacteria bacterium OttesenSCG-928-K17]|nr:translation initiation factor IF-2 [Deltaproteobacteria bacterium OttesenSCG-928-K17]